jgi:hypothetical protein
MLDTKYGKLKFGGTSSGPSDKMPLISEGAQFDLLSVELRLLGTLCTSLRKSGFWTEQLEAQWDSFREELLDQMNSIAVSAIEMQAQTPEQLQIKARIFLEYCAPEGGDVPDQLSISICKDILASGSVK